MRVCAYTFRAHLRHQSAGAPLPDTDARSACVIGHQLLECRECQWGAAGAAYCTGQRSVWTQEKSPALSLPHLCTPWRLCPLPCLVSYILLTLPGEARCLLVRSSARAAPWMSTTSCLLRRGSLEQQAEVLCSPFSVLCSVGHHRAVLHAVSEQLERSCAAQPGEAAIPYSLTHPRTHTHKTRAQASSSMPLATLSPRTSWVPHATWPSSLCTWPLAALLPCTWCAQVALPAFT